MNFYFSLKLRIILLFLFLFLTLSIFPLFSFQSSAYAETVITVPATAEWVNTSLKINSEDTLHITATGSWRPGSGFGTWGPDGSPDPWEDNFLNLTDIGVCNFCATTKTGHFASLIGYIGDNPPATGSYASKDILPEAKKVFFVGNNFDNKVNNTGTLWLNFNDDAYSNYTIDNWGEVTAKIVITSAPPQEPFLDLPWDYEKKGLSFNDAATAINSYFDHTYPLLSRGLDLHEPADFLNQVTIYGGKSYNESDRSYSSHDGYDYGSFAKISDGDPVLAAADGIATFTPEAQSGGGGNIIKINHGNGYQTWYEHLYTTDHVAIDGQEKVKRGQKIGKVGHTGNCWSQNSKGEREYQKPSCAHIHFGVFQDKNHDGTFEDNVPDGVTDPYGWQSKESDPWETYSFFYNGQQRTGNKSYYLWRKLIDYLNATLTSNGGAYASGRYSLIFPQNATDKNLFLSLRSEPVEKPFNNIIHLIPLLHAEATEENGNSVTQFLQQFSLTIDFTNVDLSNIKQDSLSIQSSQDGKTWTKEQTTLDLVNKKARASLNHFTHFTLTGEKVDTIAPVTTATFLGTQGKGNWFRSDVTVELLAKDNDGGLGIKKTWFKKDTRDWETYTVPLSFTTEGTYTIEFYSEDNGNNSEDIQSITFRIDKSQPKISCSVSPNTIWPPDNKLVLVKTQVTVTDDLSGANGFLLDSVTGNEILIPDDYPGFIPGTNTTQGQLRAKRLGSGDGRIYNLNYKGMDNAGNTTTCTSKVTVLHDQGK